MNVHDNLGDQVTVVVLTHNRRDEVLRTVDRLRQLPTQLPVVVVDNASADGSAEALRARDPALQVVRLERNAGAAGRNVGVRLARTPYVAFCDDDTWWEQDSLERAVERLDHEPRLAVVTGHVLVGDEGRIDEICEVMARTPLAAGDEADGYQVLGFLAGASVVRREAFLEVGGFAEPFLVGGEEELVALDLAARGWTLKYAPDVVVRHYPSKVRNPRDRRRLMIRNSLWTAILRYPPRLLLPHSRHVAAQARAAGLARVVAAETLRAAPWLLAHRRRLSGEVVSQLQLLRQG